MGPLILSSVLSTSALFLEASYCQGVDTGTLPGQLSVLEAYVEDIVFRRHPVGGDEGS